MKTLALILAAGAALALAACSLTIGTDGTRTWQFTPTPDQLRAGAEIFNDK